MSSIRRVEAPLLEPLLEPEELPELVLDPLELDPLELPELDPLELEVPYGLGDEPELEHPPETNDAAIPPKTKTDTPTSTFCLFTSAPRSYTVRDSETAPVARDGRTCARVPSRMRLPVQRGSILGSSARLTNFVPGCPTGRALGDRA
jgi:hypothetical protein